MKKLTYRVAQIGVMIMALAACSSMRQEESVSQTFPFIRLSPSAPPQAQAEEKPVTMEPMREIWRDGFWVYDGKEFRWVSGHYILRPNPTAAWTPDRWEKRRFGWAFVPGFWQ